MQEGFSAACIHSKLFGYFRQRNMSLIGMHRYEDYAVSQFVSVKDQGAKGDGKTDDTAALQAVLNDVG